MFEIRHPNGNSRSTCPQPTGTPLEIACGLLEFELTYCSSDIDPDGTYTVVDDSWKPALTKAGKPARNGKRVRQTVVLGTFTGREILAAHRQRTAAGSV
jgi:hypothetical protein